MQKVEIHIVKREKAAPKDLVEECLMIAGSLGVMALIMVWMING